MSSMVLTLLNNKKKQFFHYNFYEFLKKLRSFLRPIHQIGKLIPNLLQVCQPIKHPLKINKKFE